jgi:hypothetical protein
LKQKSKKKKKKKKSNKNMEPMKIVQSYPTPPQAEKFTVSVGRINEKKKAVAGKKNRFVRDISPIFFTAFL